MVIILDLSHPIAWLVRHVCSGVLSYFNVVAIQNSLDGFRNTPNVRNNSKTSRWFPFIRSATSCNWFFEVGILYHPCIQRIHRTDQTSVWYKEHQKAVFFRKKENSALSENTCLTNHTVGPMNCNFFGYIH